MKLRTRLSRLLASSPIAFLPVRVRKGAARGARWTLLPFSANWRHGGEGDLEPGLARLKEVRGAVCWDFGAHFGIHTVGMAMQVGLSGQVVAFEPDPVAFARLELHVRKNDLSNVVSILAAVSSSSDSVELISVGGLGSTLSHLRYPDEPVAQAEVTLEVKSVVPDALVASGRIRLPDLIKVDVQGHGASALRGSIESIRARHPVIIFSSHRTDPLGAPRCRDGNSHCAFNAARDRISSAARGSAGRNPHLIVSASVSRPCPAY